MHYIEPDDLYGATLYIEPDALGVRLDAFS
jgi:hypothetical protein